MTEYFNLNNSEIEELLVNRFNTILDSQGTLTPVVTISSPVTSYSNITQRRRLGDKGCLSLVTFIEM